MYFLVLLSALLACVGGVPLNTTNPRLDGRIVGGNETDITSHPYQVSVMTSGSYRCSGSIISANWVVTLPYCVNRNVGLITVRSGSTCSNSGGIVHSATIVIVHESYDDNNFDYDVALVQVSPAFTFDANIQPITLECDPVPVGTDAVLTGWGPSTALNHPLQQVTVKILSDSECNSSYAIYGGITDRMICAMDPNGGKGACWDYGAHLVASNKLVGIFSWSLGCAFPDYPEVYTKMSAVCDWIAINAGLY